MWLYDETRADVGNSHLVTPKIGFNVLENIE